MGALKIEDLTAGLRVRGLGASGMPVEIVAVQPFGTVAASVTFREATGTLESLMLYEDDVAGIEVCEGPKWSFSAEANLLKLASEAYRISKAYLFDPYLAVTTSEVEPLPHQISAVYQEMLPRMPLRYVLADDPGAGKTVMTGLLIKEMLARGDLRRCLVVSPGSLVEQWQDELLEKFGLAFKIMTNEVLEASPTGNAFAEEDLCIARLDKLSRSDELQEKLAHTTWDLVVFDEAHKLSATMGADGAKRTKRYKLAELVGATTPNLLLLTATPHNGKQADFQLFMKLVDPDQFEGALRHANQHIDVSSNMRRLVKEELLRFDGTPLFPERRAYTVDYTLTPAESGLYEAVTDYVTTEFNRADALDGKRRTSVGFALTSLQRRLASSPEAIYQSLHRRRVRLEKRLEQVRAEMAAGRKSEVYAERDVPSGWEDFDEDDWETGEAEAAEDDVTDSATAAQTAVELECEIGTLTLLERRADDVRRLGRDRKWEQLSSLLQDEAAMRAPDGHREKIIVFTEYKDTLNYLVSNIANLLGDSEAVVQISGGMRRDERRRAQDEFRQNPHVHVMVATDAAGEGVNLQRAHLMVNYDLPWNPNRLEQRFGRIHRIGQTEVCHLWNLVASQTREGDVFKRLFGKLEAERQALGGKVFDVLGRVKFQDKSLRELLVDAVRYGNDPEVKARLHRQVESGLDTQALRDLIDEYALTDEAMDAAKVASVRQDMERAAARRLQPGYIEDFFVAAMRVLGGKALEREPGRWEVRRVPEALVQASSTSGKRSSVLSRYERVCFDKARKHVEGLPDADLCCPGHPLLDALVQAVVSRFGGLLQEGAVLIDDADSGCEPRLLVYLEDKIQDATTTLDGKRRVVYEAMKFAEVWADGRAKEAGHAPYLDYRAPSDDERRTLAPALAQQAWLAAGKAEDVATELAVSRIVPEDLRVQRAVRQARVEKTRRNVVRRLDAEIRYWDAKAAECEQKERAGKTARITSAYARSRADGLMARKKDRLARLEKEERLMPLPPRVVSACVVVPAGLVAQLMGEPTGTVDAQARREVELAAMAAVMNIERELGNDPVDVSAEKCGYDVLSRTPVGPDGHVGPSRFIEVKGRATGATTVTVSRNEVLCALNNPDTFVLALVDVSPTATVTTYYREPFDQRPDSSACSCTYDVSKLMKNARKELVKESAR